MKKIKNLRKRLRRVMELDDWIKSIVAEEALMNEEIEAFFNDLSKHGCVSWMIGFLVWYNQTHAFYDKHYYEVEEIRDEWEDSVWVPIVIKGDLKNFFAWFAFEEVAYNLALELWIEI